MKNVQREIIVNVSKSKVWDLLFNRFGEVNNFNLLIEGSQFTTGIKGELGVERQCQLDSKNAVEERITEVRGDSGFDIDIVKGATKLT